GGGEGYEGEVVNITKFGAFVNILPGTDGLLHISKLDGSKRVERVEDYLALGDKITVRVGGIDRGKLSLELVNALPGATLPEPGSGGGGNGGNGGGEGRDRGDRRGGGRDRDRGDRRGGDRDRGDRDRGDRRGGDRNRNRDRDRDRSGQGGGGERRRVARSSEGTVEEDSCVHLTLEPSDSRPKGWGALCAPPLCPPDSGV